MEKEFLSKGYLTFYLTEKGLSSRIISREEYLSANFCNHSIEALLNIIDFKFSKPIYDMFHGLEFVRMIENGNINYHDGFISEIYVDGYLSNLGIITDTFECGEFLVFSDVFKEICSKHDVLVNWAAK